MSSAADPGPPSPRSGAGDAIDSEARQASDASAVADAFRDTLDLFGTGLALMRQNLRRRHPEASDDEVERLLDAWIVERPDAPTGDCPGRRVDDQTGRA